MVGKSKYDVIDDEEKKCTLEVRELVSQIGMLTLKLMLGEIDKDTCEQEVLELNKKMFSKYKLMAHLGFENSKDLYVVKPSVLSVTNPTNFTYDYSKVINRYAKILLIFAMIDEEGIDIAKIDDLDVYTSILDDDVRGLLKVFVPIFDDMSLSNCELATRLLNENLVVSDLSQEHIDKLNDYHNNFIRRYINPKVDNFVCEEERVIKLAKRIGALGRDK